MTVSKTAIFTRRECNRSSAPKANQCLLRGSLAALGLALAARGNDNTGEHPSTSPPIGQTVHAVFLGTRPVGEWSTPQGARLCVTAGHLLYSANRSQWVPAGTLGPGDRVQAGRAETVELRRRPGKSAEAIHNLEVAHEHAYFVGEEKIPAHNASQATSPSTRPSTSQSFPPGVIGKIAVAGHGGPFDLIDDLTGISSHLSIIRRLPGALELARAVRGVAAAYISLAEETRSFEIDNVDNPNDPSLGARAILLQTKFEFWTTRVRQALAETKGFLKGVNRTALGEDEIRGLGYVDEAAELWTSQINAIDPQERQEVFDLKDWLPKQRFYSKTTGGGGRRALDVLPTFEGSPPKVLGHPAVIKSALERFLSNAGNNAQMTVGTSPSGGAQIVISNPGSLDPDLLERGPRRDPHRPEFSKGSVGGAWGWQALTEEEGAVVFWTNTTDKAGNPRVELTVQLKPAP